MRKLIIFLTAIVINVKLHIALGFHKTCDLPILCLKCYKEYPDYHELDLAKFLEITRKQRSLYDVLVNTTNPIQENKKLFVQSKTLL